MNNKKSKNEKYGCLIWILIVGILLYSCSGKKSDNEIKDPTIKFIKSIDEDIEVIEENGNLKIKYDNNVFTEKHAYEIYTTHTSQILNQILKDKKEYTYINVIKPVSLTDGGEKILINCNFYIDDYKKVDWEDIQNLSATHGWYKFYLNTTSFNIDKSVLDTLPSTELIGLNSK